LFLDVGRGRRFAPYSIVAIFLETGRKFSKSVEKVAEKMKKISKKL
jgi:hypothetical protein